MLHVMEPAFSIEKENYDDEYEMIVVRNVGKKGLALDYMNTVIPERAVSVEGAQMPLPKLKGLESYIGEERWVIMSRMYYWAQEFLRLYPNEMEVYYETENFVCYRIRQNGYCPYNFAIDYGYN